MLFRSIGYFRLATVRHAFEVLDQWLRRRLRKILWEQWRKPKTRYRLLTATAFVQPHFLVAGSTSITELMAEKEKKDAGLHKLTAAERKAFNDALLRIFIHLRQASQEDDEFSLYDSRGKVAAFIDPEDDATIYLWSGKPVAYLDKNSVYGFNGKHLGWFIKGAIYDHDGKVAAAVRAHFTALPSAPPPRGFKQFKPFKGFQEFKPFQSFLSPTWLDTPANLYFLQGVN